MASRCCRMRNSDQSPNMSAKTHKRSGWTRVDEPGFTLIELLVVIGIVGLLLSVLLPVLGSARDTAKQIRELANLRQIIFAYNVYYQEHDGHLMWGKPPYTINNTPVTVELPDGLMHGGEVATRYPWRLAPYLDEVWPVFHSYYPLDGTPLANAYNLSIYPSYGLNTVYVGGHERTIGDGFAVRSSVGDHVPLRGSHVVFKEQEVDRPSGLIVFAETQVRRDDQPHITPPFGPDQAGYFHVDPPRIDNTEVWRAEGDRIVNEYPGSSATGLPMGRYGTATGTAYFDGHVAAETPETLDDMRLWANGANSPDYDHNP